MGGATGGCVIFCRGYFTNTFLPNYFLPAFYSWWDIWKCPRATLGLGILFLLPSVTRQPASHCPTALSWIINNKICTFSQFPSCSITCYSLLPSTLSWGASRMNHKLGEPRKARVQGVWGVRRGRWELSEPFKFEAMTDILVPPEWWFLTYIDLIIWQKCG